MKHEVPVNTNDGHNEICKMILLFISPLNCLITAWQQQRCDECFKIRALNMNTSQACKSGYIVKLFLNLIV